MGRFAHFAVFRRPVGGQVPRCAVAIFPLVLPLRSRIAATYATHGGHSYGSTSDRHAARRWRGACRQLAARRLQRPSQHLIAPGYGDAGRCTGRALVRARRPQRFGAGAGDGADRRPRSAPRRSARGSLVIPQRQLRARALLLRKRQRQPHGLCGNPRPDAATRAGRDDLHPRVRIADAADPADQTLGHSCPSDLPAVAGPV